MIGTFLKAKRQELGISGKMAARYVVKSRQNKRGTDWIYYMENRRQDILVSELILLSKGLGVNAGELFQEYVNSLEEKE